MIQCPFYFFNFDKGIGICRQNFQIVGSLCDTVIPGFASHKKSALSAYILQDIFDNLMSSGTT